MHNSVFRHQPQDRAPRRTASAAMLRAGLRDDVADIIADVIGGPVTHNGVETVTGGPPITAQDVARRNAHAWTLQADR